MKPLFFCLPLAVLLLACEQQSLPPEPIARPVLTQFLATSDAAVGVHYSGEVRARYETRLGFRAAGKIVQRLVDSGAKVRAGQVLARLDETDVRLSLNSANAQRRLAEAEADRYRELRAKNFVSQSALDAKQAARDTAVAQAGLAKNQADYTILRAGYDGVVTATLAEAGEVVAAGQPIFRLAQDGEREVVIAVAESQLAGMKIGDAAEITLLALDNPDQSFVGRLRELSPVADAASRTYAAKVSFVAASPAVALGMTARVRFNHLQDGIAVPLAAIFQQGDHAALWVVGADQRVTLRPVAVAAYRDHRAVIASGVAAGERIVVAGVHKLTVGEKVRPLEPDAAYGSK
ncbi:MAG: efflux RND transporter periplasmic adaptor subunit [Pseudomonadota bacterium]